MQRQIKFRSWSNKLKSWVKSIVVSENGSPFIVFVEVNEAERTCINHVYTADDQELVIQQFTGLLDKNGKEIYEGDILKYQSSNPRFTQVVVRWTKEEEDNHPGWVVSDSYCQYGKPEITGNIFENPELLSAV